MSPEQASVSRLHPAFGVVQSSENRPLHALTEAQLPQWWTRLPHAMADELAAAWWGKVLRLAVSSLGVCRVIARVDEPSRTVRAGVGFVRGEQGLTAPVTSEVVEHLLDTSFTLLRFLDGADQEVISVFDTWDGAVLNVKVPEEMQDALLPVQGPGD